MGPTAFNILMGAILLSVLGFVLLGKILSARSLRRLDRTSSIEEVQSARRAVSDAREAARRRGALNKALDVLEAKRRREHREHDEAT